VSDDADTVIDDIAERGHLRVLIEWAEDGPIALGRLEELACGDASAVVRERYGAHWLSTLIDLAQRGGVGELERDEDGAVVFRPASVVPNFADAWRQAIRAWDD
jgi:hypothetical protein